MSAPLKPGTPVTLCDGRTGYASPDRRVGSAWNGLYRVRTTGTFGEVVGVGWDRALFEVRS